VREVHIVTHTVINGEYRFLQSQRASSTCEVNFGAGSDVESWKEIISFCRESNANVMHWRRHRHETVFVARKTSRATTG